MTIVRKVGALLRRTKKNVGLPYDPELAKRLRGAADRHAHDEAGTFGMVVVDPNRERGN